MKTQERVCIEKEAAVLHALSQVKDYRIICVAHLTHSMAMPEGNIEKAKNLEVQIKGQHYLPHTDSSSLVTNADIISPERCCTSMVF